MLEPQPVNILMVDDHPENLLALEAILDGMGLNLIKATSGAEALKWLLREEFAVILLDVQMPGMSGLETAELIKRRDRTRHVPIIFLTAINKEESYVFEGYSVGAVDYLFKPFEPTVLASKVAVFVELYRKNEQLKRQGELLREAERREKERELAELERASLQRYRNLAEAVPQMVWTAAPDGTMTFCNQRWCDYTGLGAAATLRGGWPSALHPDDRAANQAAWARGLESGELVSLEARLRRASDGAYRWHLIRAVPECDAQGAVIGWIGSCTDIDDRIRAQEALQTLNHELRDRNRQVEEEVALRTAELESQKRFNEMLLNSAGEGIYGVDAEGLITFINPAGAKVLGYEVDELIGKPIHDTLHHSHPDGTSYPPGECPIHASFRDGCVHRVSDEVFWRKDGTLVPIEYLSTPIREGEALVGAVITFQDITARKQAEAEITERTRELEEANEHLRQADRYKDEFLSVISHELRTPLNFITGFASVLKDELAGPLTAQQDDYLSKILNGADRMLLLVNDLLDFAKLQAGRLDLNPRHTALATLVEEVLTHLRPLADAKDLQLAAELPDAVPLVADEQRLVQVLTNLVGNAIKFTPPGGCVVVRARQAEAEVVVEVVDTGIGIAQPDLPKLFDRFRQIDMSVTREAGGTGLGLSIAKALIEAHGGRIGGMSPGLGQGATFWFSVPARPGAAPEPAGHASLTVARFD